MPTHSPNAWKLFTCMQIVCRVLQLTTVPFPPLGSVILKALSLSPAPPPSTKGSVSSCVSSRGSSRRLWNAFSKCSLQNLFSLFSQEDTQNFATEPRQKHAYTISLNCFIMNYIGGSIVEGGCWRGNDAYLTSLSPPVTASALSIVMALTGNISRVSNFINGQQGRNLIQSTPPLGLTTRACLLPSALWPS